MIKERKFQVEMKTLEPFRIGGKPDPMGADNPVAVVGSNVVVPGSSLKGAYRNALERYLIDQYYDRGERKWLKGKASLQPCMAGTKLSKDEATLVEQGLYRGQACHYPCVRRRNRCGDEQHEVCPVCYLLGAQGLVGFVRVPFLMSEVSASELYSARMDRAMGTVAEGTNRPYELVPHESTFRGTLYVTLEDDVLGWKLGEPRPLQDRTGGDVWLEADGTWTADKIIDELIVKVLQSVTLLGGYKSKGFGRVEIKVTPA